MNITIIDNYDSFTYNLAHLVKQLGASCTILRNDKFQLPDLATADALLLSPGPGIPAEAGLLLDVIRHYATTKPILGVCLGHQAIAEVFGGSLINLAEVFHGIQTYISITTPDILFDGLSGQLPVGRYHSWVVDAATLPFDIEVTAVSAEGQIMALRHRTLDIRGIQFHPESILTPHGSAMIANWLRHIAQR